MGNTFNINKYIYYIIIKIGFICWRQGGGTSDYVSATPKKSWMKDLKKETKGEYKGKYPFEKANSECAIFKKKNIQCIIIKS